MLITYFKNPRILARYRSGLASVYLEDFITWLESQGYRRFMIRRHVRGVVHFTDWAEAEGVAVGGLDRGALNRLCSQLEERKFLRYPSGNRRYFCHSACLFVNFLEAVVPWSLILRMDRLKTQRFCWSSESGCGRSAVHWMLREGVSLPAISALLRHASIETTTVYAKVDNRSAPRGCHALAGGAAMLTDIVNTYLSVRRAVGFKLQSVEPTPAILLSG
jgi:hypothetical protein